VANRVGHGPCSGAPDTLSVSQRKCWEFGPLRHKDEGGHSEENPAHAGKANDEVSVPRKNAIAIQVDPRRKPHQWLTPMY
jgi:hypothetical protein